ncbi:MAG: FHA domain-containing protein [Deltaproteobacteria bacterium]|nr:FHA domain-containing protein [Deltaproteobacteria bacterium]
MARVGVFHADIGTFAFEVGPRPIVVGRPGGGAQLEMTWDTLVSRAHGQFWQHGNELWYADLGSKNGSWIFGHRISGAGVRLTVGSSLTLGTTIFTVLEEASAPLGVTAPAQSFGGATAPASPHPSGLAAVQSFLSGNPQHAVSGNPQQAVSPQSSTAIARPVASTNAAPALPGASLFGPNAASLSPSPGFAPVNALPPQPPAPPQVPIPEKKKSQWGDEGVNTELFPIPLDPAAISRVSAEMFPSRPAPSQPIEVVDREALAALAEETGRAREPASPRGRPIEVRLASLERVEVVAVDRAALGKLWTEQLSKGGLFVPSESPPQTGRRLEVSFSTPDGELTTRAEVVHVLSGENAKRLRQPPGSGLQLSESWAKESLRRYVEGHDPTLSNQRSDRPGARSAAASNEILATARDILVKSEENKLYEAIGVPYTARAEEVRQRTQALAMRLNVPTPEALPAQVARVETAKKVLGRLQAILTDPIRRVEYDFRMGFTRVPERIRMAASGEGPAERELREAWQRVFPDQAERSRQAAKRAIQSAQRAKFEEAVAAAKEALEVDPFHADMRKSLAAWEAMVAKTSR